MSFAKKHNKSNLFDVNTSEREYINLSQLDEITDGKAAIVDCLYINKKGKFDDAPVIGVRCTIDGEKIMVNDKEVLVNLPAHLCSECEAALADMEDIEAIKNGKVAVKVRPYHSEQYNKECFSVDWVDVD